MKSIAAKTASKETFPKLTRAQANEKFAKSMVKSRHKNYVDDFVRIVNRFFSYGPVSFTADEIYRDTKHVMPHEASVELFTRWSECLSSYGILDIQDSVYATELYVVNPNQ